MLFDPRGSQQVDPLLHKLPQVLLHRIGVVAAQRGQTRAKVNRHLRRALDPPNAGQGLILVRKAALKKRGRAADNGEDVLQVMGHTRRNMRNHFALLSNLQLVAQQGLFGFRPRAVRDVARNHQKPAIRAGVQRQFLPDRMPFAMLAAQLNPQRATNNDLAPRAGSEPVRRLRRIKVAPGQRLDRLGIGDSEHVAEGMVHEQELPLGIQHGHPVTGPFNGQFPIIHLAAVLALKLGDVGLNRHKPLHGAAVIQHRLNIHADPILNPGPVMVHDFGLRQAPSAQRIFHARTGQPPTAPRAQEAFRSTATNFVQPPAAALFKGRVYPFDVGVGVGQDHHMRGQLGNLAQLGDAALLHAA